MAEIKHPPEPTMTEAVATAALAGHDPRKPYEAPRLLKKRSVARATLFTAVGPMGSMLTSSG
jgi:hypothetical protein